MPRLKPTTRAVRILKHSIRAFARLNAVCVNRDYDNMPLGAWIPDRCAQTNNGMYYETIVGRSVTRNTLYWQGECLECVISSCKYIRRLSSIPTIIFFFKPSHTV